MQNWFIVTFGLRKVVIRKNINVGVLVTKFMKIYFLIIHNLVFLLYIYVLHDV